MKFDARYKACYLTDIAERIGVDVNTFQAWLTPADLKMMIELGWVPFRRKLNPPVVKYLLDKFCSV